MRSKNNYICVFLSQETRLREGIVKLQPHEEPLRSELLSGKFTVLVSSCQSGPFLQKSCLCSLNLGNEVTGSQMKKYFHFHSSNYSCRVTDAVSLQLSAQLL